MTISCVLVSDDLTSLVNGLKLPKNIKWEIQKGNIQSKLEKDKIKVYSEMIDVLNKVSPVMMKKAQDEDVGITMISLCQSGKETILTQICKTKSRPVCRYL